MKIRTPWVQNQKKIISTVIKNFWEFEDFSHNLELIYAFFFCSDEQTVSYLFLTLVFFSFHEFF